MAVLKTIASGKFTSSTTWATVVNYSITTTPTATLLSTTANTSGTATGITGLSNTIDGIMLSLAYRIASPTGTVTCELYNNTTSTIDRSVTINVSDLNADTSIGSAYGGWVYFKFGSTITLNAAQSYAVRLKSSVNNQVAFNRGLTTYSWNFGFVTLTNATPLNGDTVHVVGEYISAGVSNSFTLTWDNVDSTISLAADATGDALTVNALTTLTFETSASKAYYMKMAGNFKVNIGGTVRVGTLASPIPSSSSASIEMVQASAGQYGILIYGTFQTYGQSKTPFAKLAADAAALATNATLDSTPTGWNSGDTIAIAGTTRTVTDSEKITLSSNVTTTSMSFTGTPLVVAHGGDSTSGVQADVINLTRNIKIFGTSTSLPMYIISPNCNPTWSFYYTEFYSIGTATANKYGMQWSSNAGSLDVSYCSFRDTTIASSYLIYINALSTGTVNISNCVNFNCCTVGIYLPAIVGTAWTIDKCIVIRPYVQILDASGTLTNIIVNNTSTTGITIGERAQYGTFSTITAYGCNGTGILINNGYGTISNLKGWRNVTYGLQLGSYQPGSAALTLNTVSLFGNAAANLVNTLTFGAVIIRNLTSLPGTTLTCPIGYTMNGQYHDTTFIYNSTFGPGHTTADISGQGGLVSNASLVNCTFNSTVKLSNQNAIYKLYSGGGLSTMAENNVANAHFFYENMGTLRLDTTIFNSSPQSLRMTPIYSNFKLEHKPIRIAVKAGDTPTVSVTVRKSVVGDGTAYNGNQPRLILRPCLIAGILDYTVIATASGSAGTWETVSGVLPAPSVNAVYELYVDCDGTTGWINVDDWSTTYWQKTQSINYWEQGVPYVEVTSKSSEVSSTFVN